MTTEEFQVCFWDVSKCETQSEAQSEAHLAVSPASLRDLPVELISQIAGHLDSASLHNLRNTTRWVAAAVDFDYTQRHPSRTICRSARQLPGFLKQLTLPAINMHIKRLTLSGKSADHYSAFPSTFHLPLLKRLVLQGIVMDGTSLLNMCSAHRATIRSLKIDRVLIKKVGHWEALFFQILAMLQLEKLQARDLLYKSDLTGFLCEVYLPIEGRISGLEGLKGRTEIKDLVQHYFRDSGAYVYRMKLYKVGRILREASRSKWPPSCKEVTHQHTAGPALDAQHCDPLPISSHH
jgi:hypothetical protein